MLRISPEKVCYVAAKARELDVKVAPEELDDGSNASDDAMQRILEDYADDATFEELQAFLLAQNDGEIGDLVALMWLGRGDFEVADWAAERRRVRDVREQRTVAYLLGQPLLADYLEEGLAAFGLSCAELDGDG